MPYLTITAEGDLNWGNITHRRQRKKRQGVPGRESGVTPPFSKGKIWEKTPSFKNRIKSRRINGPCVFVRAHKTRSSSVQI